MSTLPDRVRTESLKLLLQVGWGDAVLVPEEVVVIRRIAEREGVEESFRAQLDAYLDGRLPLPAPDLELLKPYKWGVLAMADVVLASDGLVTPDEHEVRTTLERLLG